MERVEDAEHQSAPKITEPGSTNDNDALPVHTRSMRQAAQYCLSTLASISPTGMASFCQKVTSHQDPWRTHQRLEAYDAFWGPLPANLSASTEPPVIPKVHYSEISPEEFRRRFHDLNLPCLVDLEDVSHTDDAGSIWFSGVNRLWRQPSESGKPESSQRHVVNRDWFVETLGLDCQLPVRFQPQESVQLDDEGRATECQTKKITLSEWNWMLVENADDRQSDEPVRNPYYLKDWHLQLQLEQRPRIQSIPALYKCPPIFEVDLLNSFLTRFTDGDYRFCYWGPRGSFTSRHSDVLHSFSWSYNVVGTKKWTFFRSSGCQLQGQEAAKQKVGGSNRVSEQTFTVIQRSGQAMFVPSQWQHEVINLEETISINHNWVTCANLDICWECLVTEIEAIDKEMKAWGIDDNLEAYESMLRGCVGLDVTGFFLMTFTRLCDLLTIVVKNPGRLRDDLQANSKLLDCSLAEATRLLLMLRRISDDEAVQLQRRLWSVLKSETLASELMNTATPLHQIV